MQGIFHMEEVPFGKNDTPLGKGLDYGPAWEFLATVGVCRPVLQILALF